MDMRKRELLIENWEDFGYAMTSPVGQGLTQIFADFTVWLGRDGGGSSH